MSKIKRFESKQVGRIWNKNIQKWYFTPIDFVEVLAESSDPKKCIRNSWESDKEIQRCIR
jgi:hypothetical protein